jgi:hypothetical protein
MLPRLKLRWAPRLPSRPFARPFAPPSDLLTAAALLVALLVVLLNVGGLAGLGLSSSAASGAAAAPAALRAAPPAAAAAAPAGGWPRPSQLAAASATASAAPPPAERPLLQGYCDVALGLFEPRFDGAPSPAPAAGAAPEGAAARVARLAREPAWALAFEDHTRRQFDELARRQRRQRLQERWHQGSRAAGPPPPPARNGSAYAPLSAVGAMAAELAGGASAGAGSAAAATAPVWAWPFAALFPMPSFVSAGEPASAEGAEPAALSASALPAASSFLLTGRRTLDRAAAAASVVGPVHGGLDLANVRGGSGVPSWEGEFSDDDAAAAAAAAGDAGGNARDSLRRNASAPQWTLLLPPALALSVLPSSVRGLSRAELDVLRGAMTRLCAALHDEYRGRVLAAAASSAGAARDGGVCDVSADYGVDSGATNGPAGAAAAAAAAVAAEADAAAAAAAESALSAAPLRRGAIYSLVVEVESGEGPGGADLALPRLASDEAYSLSISERRAAERVWLDDDDEGGFGSLAEVRAVVRAHSVWGALRGLETFAQVADGFSVARGPSAGSPLALDAQAVARVALAHVSEAPACRMGALAAAPSPAPAFPLDEDFAPAQPAAGATLPLLVLDRPWRPWRGLSLDTARHWLPVPALLSLVDGLAASKMNVLHWHFADAQSFPLQLASHPELARLGAWDADRTYSAGDVAVVVRHAAARGVRVVPELDMPAHVHAWSLSHPELLVHCSAVAGGGVKELDLYALDPTQNATYLLIAEVLGELAGLFPDEFMHIGADEVAPECWASEPRVLQWARANLGHLYASLGPGGNALSASHQAYAVLLTHFVSRVAGIVRGLGRRPLTWEDSFEKVEAASAANGARRAKQQDAAAAGDAADAGAAGAEGAKPAALPALAAAMRRVLADASARSTRGAMGSAASILAALQGSVAGVGRGGGGEGGGEAGDGNGYGNDIGGGETSGEVGADGRRRASAGAAAGAAALSASPGAGSVAYPEGVTIQAWKCWVQHADEVALAAALSGVRNAEAAALADEDGGEGGGGGAAPAMSRGVLQSACWYLDWSSPWADFYRHWPLPETSRGMDRLARALPEGLPARPAFPAVLFSPRSPYWGGEAAMWTERVDASNLAPRVWPRAAVVGEVLWSESLAYDRLARLYDGLALPLLAAGAAAPHLGGSGGLPRTAPAEALQSLFAGPRLLQHSRRLLRRGVASSTLAVFDVAEDTPAAASASASSSAAGVGALLRPGALTFETDMPAFNGMAPGIEQAVQRNASRASALLERRVASFMTWNLHEGGGGGARLRGVLARLRELDVDVVAVTEANDWDQPPPARRLRRRAAVGAAAAAAEAAAGSDYSVPREELEDEEEEEEAAPLEAGRDEITYLANATLRRGLQQPSTAHVRAQAAGFRRRAAAAGYAHAHLLRVASGYHLALLSALPLVVVLEDQEHFERGLLVADAGGVRFMLAHLHAQDAVKRAAEAAWAARLAARYTAAGLRVVLLGDANSLSPRDDACIRELGTVAKLTAPSAPAYLRGKFLRPSTAAAGGFEPDYRPLEALAAGGLLADLSPPVAPASSAGNAGNASNSSTAPAAFVAPAASAACLAACSFPTEALGLGDGGADGSAVDDAAHAAVRVDVALANAAFLEAHPGVRCRVLRDASLATLSDHLPLLCTSF